MDNSGQWKRMSLKQISRENQARINKQNMQLTINLIWTLAEIFNKYSTILLDKY